jgi:hypothetical protein
MKSKNPTQSDRKLNPACLLLAVVFTMILTANFSSRRKQSLKGYKLFIKRLAVNLSLNV